MNEAIDSLQEQTPEQQALINNALQLMDTAPGTISQSFYERRNGDRVDVIKGLASLALFRRWARPTHRVEASVLEIDRGPAQKSTPGVVTELVREARWQLDDPAAPPEESLRLRTVVMVRNYDATLSPRERDSVDLRGNMVDHDGQPDLHTIAILQAHIDAATVRMQP